MSIRVTCVCGGYGFPISASAARIIMVGRSLGEAGIRLEVLHCGPSPISINRQRSGVHEGIPFQYTTSIRRPKGKVLRLLVYLWGAVGLTLGLARLWPSRRSAVVYLYVMDGLLNLYAGVLCRLFGLPIIQEMCEWVPDQPNSAPAFNRWLYRNWIFQAATGALAISRAIEARVRERTAATNPSLQIYRLPVLVDAQRFAAAPPLRDDVDVPVFAYCGTYLEDVLFVIRAFALVRKEGIPCCLKIVGQCGERNGPELLRYASNQGLLEGELALTGCIDEDTLQSTYKSGAALLMPLWNNDKSLTRLPNKMGEYLASGRPVVTCAIGDLTEILTDGVTAYISEPGEEGAFAGNMLAVLKDPARAERIGAAGQQRCFALMDYRGGSEALTAFVLSCTGRREKTLGVEASLPATGSTRVQDTRR